MNCKNLLLSQVHTLINGVLPKKNPKMYAAISLQITLEMGTRNLEKDAQKVSEVGGGRRCLNLNTEQK